MKIILWSFLIFLMVLAIGETHRPVTEETKKQETTTPLSVQYAIISAPLIGCSDGQQRDKSGQCRTVLNFKHQ